MSLFDLYGKTAKQMLLEAAEHMERAGWHQGDYYASIPGSAARCDLESPCCMLGALHAVGLPFPWFQAAPMTDAIEKCLGKGVHQWNDEDCQSQEEAVAKLRELAERIKEAE
jgi:hypothetical protein